MINFLSKRKKPEYGWFGNYASWQEASALTRGYEQANILEKTKEALLKVKNGEAVYERDSVLFDKKEYPFPLISFVLHTALQKGLPLHILDFGGSLGSTYFQIKEFLTPGVCSSWNIVEQAHYIDYGRKFFEDEMLHFFHSVEECTASYPIDLIILSSVVQYLPDPYGFIKKLTSYGFKAILFDRTAFVNGNSDRLTIQKVWPSIYEASYPTWFFNEAGFLQHFEKDYMIAGEFNTYVEGEAIVTIDHEPIGYEKGFYLIKK
ncbi:methyltransferase, TIGR04325 family [Siphonobacter sp. SORGH_AS_0500]|uniref:methyltransferase, TIGR04325 family n=1 Tax=Siphonobacter sp. SORGH_AS_0500 TaxID=1864824 RepID=UPI00286D5245|nr:methyltransferase, TIGR04325 family [Siphonobacter sp. SORGH_AS_0500]